MALSAAREAGLAASDASTLRDLEGVDPAALARVLDPVLLRRVRHVLTENERVEAFVMAMRAGDHGALGALLDAGHRSLRDDYEVSIPELDHLCESANACSGVVGSRMTGAGFGGCTFHLVERGRAGEVRAALESGFRRRFGRALRTFCVQSADGAVSGRLDDHG
jgi:galactokinase